MNEFENKRLTEALRNGNEVVFNEIFNHFIEKLTRFISGFINSREDAKELAQDVFYSLWTKREELYSETNIKSFLYVTAKNAAINFIKKKKRHQNYVDNEFHVGDKLGYSVEEQYRMIEIELIVEAALDKVPPQCAKIYRMSRNQGISNSEIAEKLGIGRGVVEVQISRALTELRKVLTAFVIFSWM